MEKQNKNKLIITLSIIAGLLFCGITNYYFLSKFLDDPWEDDEKTEYTDPEKEISLSNQDLININNKLNQSNQPNQKSFAQSLYWIPNNKVEMFYSGEAKLFFLSNIVIAYEHVVTDPVTKKSYIELSSLQEISREYFQHEFNPGTASLEYYKKSGYNDFVYLRSGEREMKTLNPLFKATKISYDIFSKVYTLFIDILSLDEIGPDDDAPYAANDYLNYDKSLVVATGEIKYKKSADEQKNYLVSFKYVEQ
jgi:hypothetical protein